ncbi:hypothetical protein BCR36DRAFT_584745 [Piromyces finnis]|uniref:Uncharacterized protein n=1 Tax=Piromyces finnis TaxID=1754191 RepID=A0A1Y1V5E2_9FUNG|nr:hypothetical protein BCR36DRAFT_584745 [Piromyces finnis]|eukprot:ORX47640.1 hypothetical protein BCR36DRAFT_584745 [Piromyces finnis]
MKSVYAMCIIYNLVKVFGIITFFLSNPIDLHTKSVMVNGIIQTFIPKDLQKFNIAWWSTVAVINIVSIFYDISVIYCMRKSFFDRLKEYKTHKENTFMDKFKQISEFRIIISLVSSMLFLLFVIPFVVMIVMENIKNIKTPYTVSEYKKDDIEQLRQVVLSINYNLMYIDQILLQTFVKENTTIKIKVNKNSNHSTSSSSIKYNHSPYQKLNITTNLYGSETLNFSPSSYSSPSSTFQKPSINSTPNSTMGLSNTDSTTFNDSYYEPFYLENKNYSNVELFNYYPNNERKYENSKGINFHKISSPSKDNDYYESHNLSSSCKSYTNNRNIFSSSHYCINDLKQ